MSPASLPKRGSGFDAGIAVAILSAAGVVPAASIDGVAFLGELGLDGQLRPVRGVLPAVAAAAGRGFRRVAVPEANAAEAALVPGIRVASAATLRGLLGWLRGGLPGCPADQVEVIDGGADPARRPQRRRGRARPPTWLMCSASRRPAGPPRSARPGLPPLPARAAGAGKTMLAERIPSVLPRLDAAAALEVTAIHSVAGVTADRARC